MLLYSKLLKHNYLIGNHLLRTARSKMTNNFKSLDKRVLSIQSHVVHGYVGNKSATFPLQILGFEVDAINSVHLSNHTGYDHIKGQIMTEKELEEIFSGICANDLHKLYTHLLTGYVGNDSFLRNIAKIVRKLRETNPELVYVCDPVMGDDGHMYVPKTLLPIYRDEIIPLADIATPNQYEVELLTDTKISSEDDAWKAMCWFHNKGVKTVAISSTDLGGDEFLLAFLSHKEGNDIQQFKLCIPKKGGHIRFTGTGDLFASLFLAHTKLTNNVGSALENATASLQAVIQNTLNSIPENVRSGEIPVTSQQRELKIIASKKDIEIPKVVLHAVKLDK